MTEADLEPEPIPDDAAEQAGALFARARAMFAGRHPLVIGAALAQLTALWLASHLKPDDPEATADYREDLLRRQIEAVRGMMPANEERVAEVLRTLRRAH